MKTRCRISGLDGLKVTLAKVKEGVASPEILEKAAAGLKERILERTALGRDVDGEAFAPYSPRYAKRRARAGKDAKLVTLRSSGAMLDSITTQARQTEVSLGFNPSKEALKASRLQAAGVGDKRIKRRFFVVSEDDRAWVVRTVAGGVKEKIKEALK
ncbi:MAG: phage virion morphogenesis protein [Deltaproteobacteria bacterium]|nr:phage virion morphogenesis protein [Deltaproteobacteria bacterium]